MYHVSEASSSWHIKGINVHFAKEHARHCDEGWIINMMEMLLDCNSDKTLLE